MTKKEVIEYYGSVNVAADKLQLTVQAIYKWPDELSPRQARYVEMVSGGRIVDNRTQQKMGIGLQNFRLNKWG